MINNNSQIGGGKNEVITDNIIRDYFRQFEDEMSFPDFTRHFFVL